MAGPTRGYCPLCSAPITICTRGSGDVTIRENKVIFSIKGGDSEINVIFDSVSNRVLDTEFHYRHLPVISNYNNTMTSPPLYVGHFYVRIAMKCRGCSCYEFVIQTVIHLDQEAPQIDKLIFNSESIDFDEFRIHNSYTSKITTFSTLLPGTIDSEIIIPPHFGKGLELPLVALNRYNPQETIDRIKNLIIFS